MLSRSTICDTISLIWSRTFLLGVGLTDLSHFGRHLGQNKAIVSVFNKSVVYFNVRVVLTFLARIVILVKNLISTYFGEEKMAVEYR